MIFLCKLINYNYTNLYKTYNIYFKLLKKNRYYSNYSNYSDLNLLNGLTSAQDECSVTLVQDKDTALRVLDKIKSLGKDHIHACDTEVADIDIKSVGPVGNGFVTCLSLYSGPNINYGNGPHVWIDNLDGAEGTLEYFREFLENKEIKKVWHNYSFDRHVLYNHNINVRGLGGDTMHMARLWDTSRSQKGGYSLESLSSDLMKSRKTPMKELFGIPKPKKDGTPGKELQMPPIRELQRSSKFRKNWIRYSVFDAECTWFLHRFLKNKLEKINWYHIETMENKEKSEYSMYDFYKENIVLFGECLTEIERRGMRLDLKYLSSIEKRAREDREILEKSFINWVRKYCDDADRFNLYSSAQKQQLLFAPYLNEKNKEMMPEIREFSVENIEGIMEPDSNKKKKNRKISIKGLGMEPIKFTATGMPAASAEVLRQLAGQPLNIPPKYGPAYNHFGKNIEGKEACIALHNLCEINSINTMLNNFILPLQELADKDGRVHCSLNLNTDTGRLSSRKPNLQNQPALEKDRYKIRDGFIAPTGKKLIVADYSQLELRLLAHITNCKGMIDAFEAGGDFHSRTAMGMYDYVAESVEKGETLLEWNYSDKKEKPSIPLLKDRFPIERRNAKILNFSIAYGKTAFGLAKDFGVSRKEAADILSKWYKTRQEVKEWQENTIDVAHVFGYTRTLMGRYRMLPDAMKLSKSFIERKARSHAERAAINTPIQGAAADVVMKAMLNIHKDTLLNRINWHMVCQIHDEIILEGPEETAIEARERLIHLMENPFKDKLLVRLEVDAKIDSSWYKAK